MTDNTRVSADNLPSPPFTQSGDEIVAALESSSHGLTLEEASVRLSHYGPNSLPKAKPPGILRIFLLQFASPLIYVLLIATLISILIGELSDAAFIGAVLLVNAVIGTAQEFSAQRAAEALQQLVTAQSRVLREGETYVIDAKTIVPGDIVLLESGDRIPADLRLLRCYDLEVDESLLTGESVPVLKNASAVLSPDSVLGDRYNMVFAGTMINRGRARGIVTSTGLQTELGDIAAAVLGKPLPKAPLMVRMEKFTYRVALFVLAAALILAIVALMRGIPLAEIFFLAVALAVSAIPEGLPVALTVALAISMWRMARRNVIVRRLVAVEALGSCTFIATDKTGTLTMNQLTARRLVFPRQEPWEITGESSVPEGAILSSRGLPNPEERMLLARLCQTAVLANEGFLARRDHGWQAHGDTVDVALLIMAHKAGVGQAEAVQAFPELSTIPFESEHLFSASLNEVDGRSVAFVKGALERLLPMCTSMSVTERTEKLDAHLLEQQAHTMASQGYRLIALASGEVSLKAGEVFSEEHLTGLTFIGMIAMIDPLRPESKSAVEDCRSAGIEVAMVTGDHPVTAFAIGRELELVNSPEQVVSGIALRQATDNAELDRLTSEARVFARVEPQQKLGIVQSLQRNGHFVAVSGDGANDAPALRAAQVGVAMGKSGTDVARETADLIITDDNFASIVSGIVQGRIAYANVRKVIFLLISTGAAEIVLFTLALFTGLPLPLLAVQLLWLNLVTNGIQDVALAFEPGEGDELRQPPRSPREGVFNRIMIERVILSALTVGVVAFALFYWLLEQGYSLEEARNGTLLLMVLFENIHVFNCRSETRSVFRHSLMRNRLLLFGTATAQLVHIGAMYTPWLSDVLRIQPVTPTHWLELLGLAFSILVTMELYKLFYSRYQRTFSGTGNTIQ